MTDDRPAILDQGGDETLGVKGEEVSRGLISLQIPSRV